MSSCVGAVANHDVTWFDPQVASKRVAIYARISVSTDESVSIARQVESARTYAKVKGWTVVAEHVDEGISATTKRPEERPGWRALLTSDAQFEAVVIWKIDRLARRTLDFLQANEALAERGAAIVAVEDHLDLTTKQGQAFATLLAVFGELEAAAISDRVKAARTYLVQNGRVVGGSVPYGWMSVDNPDGQGKVRAQDPERIEWVRGMAARALDGETIYSIAQWLTDERAPLPKATQGTRKHPGFNYITVERLLRSPVLAGMTPYQPGRGRNEKADPTAVVRDESGLPVIDESIAVLSVAEHRRLLSILDSRDSAQARPRASKNATSPFLSRLVKCAHCERTMHRGASSSGRETLKCPGCNQTLSTPQFKEYLIDRLLSERGNHYSIREDAEPVDVSDELVAVGAAIQDLLHQIGSADTKTARALFKQVEGLKERRDRLSGDQPPAAPRFRRAGPTVTTLWQAATTDDERRAVLAGQIESLRVSRGQRGGKRLDTSRIDLRWLPNPLFERQPD